MIWRVACGPYTFGVSLYQALQVIRSAPNQNPQIEEPRQCVLKKRKKKKILNDGFR